MCNKKKEILVTIDKSLSCTGKTKKKLAKIDYCISDIVNALESCGIYMLGSCCGHNKTNGEILLIDGRILHIIK